MKFAFFNVLELVEKDKEERQSAMENRKRHVDAIEEGMAYGKRHKEGREFADSHNFVFRFCFIVFYH